MGGGRELRIAAHGCTCICTTFLHWRVHGRFYGLNMAWSWGFSRSNHGRFGNGRQRTAQVNADTTRPFARERLLEFSDKTTPCSGTGNDNYLSLYVGTIINLGIVLLFTFFY